MSQGMTSIQINGVTTPLVFRDDPRTPDSFGCHRQVAQVGGLLLFLDSRDGQQVLIVENTLNSEAAPASVDYAIEVNGQRLEVKGHKRLRRTWIFSKWTDQGFGGNGLLMRNDLTWSGWLASPLWQIPPTIFGSDTRQTGGRPCLGTRVAWANDPWACIALGAVLGHFPITLRDPQTLQLVRDNSIRMGFPDPKGIKGDLSNWGMKLDTAHSWSAIEGYLAAKGTVLERYYAELVEALAVYSCMSDYNNLWKKELRGAGRSIRAAVDWNDLCGQGDNFVYQHLKEALDHYLSRPMLDCYSAIRVSKSPAQLNRRCIAPFEWVQLLYAIYIAHERALAGQLAVVYLKTALNWFAKMPGVPYEIALSDPLGKDAPLWPLYAVLEHEAELAAASPTRYTERLYDAYVFDWLRFQLDMPTLRPLDDPVYVKALGSANNAGFHLRWKPKPKFVVTCGEFSDTYSKVYDTEKGAIDRAQQAIMMWDGKSNFEATVKIEVKR